MRNLGRVTPIFLLFIFQSCLELDKTTVGSKLFPQDTVTLPGIGNNPPPAGSLVLPPGAVVDANCDEENILAPLGFNDPYAGCLWHIINREQKIKRFNQAGGLAPYFTDRGKSGADLNMTAYALTKYSGKGVKIHVSDDSLDPNHEDFKENYDRAHSKSCDAFGEDPIETGGSHGIKVSGAIGARGKNGIGLSGISYEGSISGYNAFGCENFVFAINVPQVNIWSASYGIPSCSAHTREDSIYHESYLQGAVENKVLYLKSSGNDRQESSRCPGGFGDANRDPSNINPYVFNIAALDNTGAMTSYSSPGSNIFVAGPAGYGGRSNASGVCTIDRNNSYTCSMNGTSVSTPNIAGSVGLIKEANRKLGPIDLMYILAKTSRPIEEPVSSKQYLNRSLAINGKEYINKSTNSAGFTHSYNAGFGLPDIDSAVKLAESYTEYKGNLEQYSEGNGPMIHESDRIIVSVSPGSCMTKNLTVDQNFQVFLNRVSLEATGVAKSIVIFQIAPDGTRSQIVRDSEISGGGYSHDQKFKSFSAFATNAKGDWDYEICNNGASAVNVTSVRLELWGYADMGTME